MREGYFADSAIIERIEVINGASRNFGDQRIELTLNRFNLAGDGDCRNEPGIVAAGLATTSVEGRPPGDPARNKVRSASLDYRHAALADGALTVQLFRHDFASLYGATNTVTFQDTRIAPNNTLFDQSHIVADKPGSRMTCVRRNTLVRALEATVGLDFLKDHTLQRLAATDRTWVPALKFQSLAPFAQPEYGIGPLTPRGGVRHENAAREVDTCTTLAACGRRVVQGGSAEFSKSVRNIGAVWRVAPGWSVFAASSEGFGLSDAGLVPRGVNRDGQSVSSLISLQPIVTRNNEIGVNWRGAQGHPGFSRYDSRAKLGSVIRIIATSVGVLERLPATVAGKRTANGGQ